MVNNNQRGGRLTRKVEGNHLDNPTKVSPKSASATDLKIIKGAKATAPGLIKKNKETAEVEFLKQTLEHRKEVYDTFLRALVKYAMPELAYTAIVAEDHHDRLMELKLKETENDPVEFARFFFGDGKPINEKEAVQNAIKHYDRMISMAKYKINCLNNEDKKKIAKDAVEESIAWMDIQLIKPIQDKVKKNNERR